MKMNKSFINDDILYKYEKESGKLRLSGGSWTINLDKQSLDSINYIVYITSKFRYKISCEDALNKGYIRNFRGENKLIVPFKHWRKYAISI